MVLDIVLVAVCLIAFLGQLLCLIAPDLATKVGVSDQKELVEKAHYIIEGKAEAVADSLLLWVLPLGILLKIFGIDSWQVVTLIGSGIYMYFSILIVLTRIFLRKHQLKYGTNEMYKMTILFGMIWFLTGVYYLVVSL